MTIWRARLRLQKLACQIEVASKDPFEREVPKSYASQMDLDRLVEAFK